MPITLPTGQVINDNDPNYATYVAQQKANTGATGNAVVNAATTASATPNMTLSEAQAKADAQLSGLATPMSLSEIRSREAEQKAAALAGAEAQYNPQIRAEQASGRRVLSSAEGATGQRQGFNLSTAESAYLSGIEADVNQRVKDVENQKAAAISTGNLAAIQRAEDNIAKLTEAQNNIALKKIELGLQYYGIGLQERQLATEEKAQEFNEQMAEKNLAINLAQLTGEYEGSPTYAAKQAAISNALAEANLTGYYNGKKTLEAVTSDAQLELQKQGIELDRQQLAETIRSNRAQEGLSASRLTSEKAAAKTPTDVTNETIARLTNLRNSGQLNDANYAAETRTLASALGYDTDSLGELQSIVNRAMEGDTSSKQYLANQANQSMGSDFVTENRAESFIEQARKSGLTKESDIRYILKQKGLSDREIANSSVGNLVGKVFGY